MLVAALLAYRRHTKLGGRGFKGNIDVDAAAFLAGDPTENYHGDVLSVDNGGGRGGGGEGRGAASNPLIDPRDDSFASGWSGDDGGGAAV